MMLCFTGLLVLGSHATSATAQGLVRFDFETGDLQGWKIVEGAFGPLPCARDDDRWGGNYNKQGKYLINTTEKADGNFDDGMTGELRSPAFTLHSPMMTLLVGGGAHATTYVALCQADDGTELFRESGRNRAAMDRRYWDVRKHVGAEVYVKIVDHEKGGWGHVNADDIREMTEDEVKAREEELARVERERKERYERWLEQFRRPAERMVYHGESLRSVAMPMGGIGAGSIAIGGDGNLRQWQIHNEVNATAFVPHTFFAIRARPQGGQPVAKALATSCFYDTPFNPEPHINDHVIPGQLREQMKRLPGCEDIRFIGEYPIAQLTYEAKELPVQVQMECYSPFVPLDAQASAWPAIVFEFTVKNPSDKPVDVALLGTLQNAVGWDGKSEIVGVANPGYGGNVNELVKSDGLTTVNVTAPRLAVDDRRFGSMALAGRGEGWTACAQWDDLDALWRGFAAGGQLPASQEGASAAGRTWNGALLSSGQLGPGAELQATLLVTWHFPNHTYGDFRCGNRYNVWFKSALEVAQKLAVELPELARRTRRFRDTMYDTTLPYWLIDCLTANISTIRSQTCMWFEDGTFAAYEGCACCPMNCTHVWNYEQTMAFLFPELERDMRRLDLTIQMADDGAVHHRLALPLTAPRGSGPFCDGQFGTILKAYREHLLSPDRKWLDEMWPRIERAMQYAIQTWDSDLDGVTTGTQWNTYDCAVHSPSTFLGSQYLAALRAAEEMAKLEGDAPLAASYRRIFDSGTRKQDEMLWNGEYYQQLSDPLLQPINEYATGCHADQLLGQWWANVVNLGPVLPPEHVRQAEQAIVKYNWRTDLRDHVQSPRQFANPERDMGMILCTWPKGPRPANAILYADEVWSSTAYHIAAMLIREGDIETAYHIVKAGRDCYDGFRRNPWNEIECGDHYARNMDSWSLLLAAQGFVFDGPAGVLGFAPKIKPEDFRSFFSGPEGWGSVSRRATANGGVWELKVALGQVSLNELVLTAEGAGKQAKVTAKLGEREVSCRVVAEGTTARLRFEQPVELKAGDTLKVGIVTG